MSGYQDLTNKLLRNINEKLAEELAIVSNKLGRLEKVMGISDGDDSDLESEVEDDEDEPMVSAVEELVKETEVKVVHQERLTRAASVEEGSGSRSSSPEGGEGGASSSTAGSGADGSGGKKRRKKKKQIY